VIKIQLNLIKISFLFRHQSCEAWDVVQNLFETKWFNLHGGFNSTFAPRGKMFTVACQNVIIPLTQLAICSLHNYIITKSILYSTQSISIHILGSSYYLPLCKALQRSLAHQTCWLAQHASIISNHVNDLKASHIYSMMLKYKRFCQKNVNVIPCMYILIGKFHTKLFNFVLMNIIQHFTFGFINRLFEFIDLSVKLVSHFRFLKFSLGLADFVTD